MGRRLRAFLMAESLAPLTAPVERATTTDRRRQRLIGAGTFVLLVAAGAAHGGYFPGSWGWLTLACAWAALLALAFDTRVVLTRTGAVFALALAGFVVWSALSALWSTDVTDTLLQVQRILVYVAAASGVLLLARGAFAAVVTATWAAGVAVCGYALLTRIVPDRFGVVDPISGYRLSEPVGYWNALGLLGAMCALLAVGLAAHARHWWMRPVAIASVPLFTTTLYFTFSRGAWAALFVGTVAVLLVDPERFRAAWWLLLGAAATAVALLLATREHALTHLGTPLPDQASQGHQLLVRLLVLGALTGLAGIGWAALDALVARRTAPFRRRIELATAALLVVAALGFFGAAGTPWHLAERGWHHFENAPVASGPNLNGRLFTIGNDGRIDQWRVAWQAATHHPLAGTGAATFERYWYLHRPSASKVRNAHNLYLETFATLGAIGLALLVTAFAAPAVAFVRRRRDPYVPFAAGAFAAYLAHALVDWDWQITGVTLPAVLLAGSVCAGGGNPVTGRAKTAVYVAVGLVAALGLWTIGAQLAVGQIDGQASAHRASRLQPWSTDPWRILAEQQLAEGNELAARATLQTALAMDSRNWQLWYDLARASAGTAERRAFARALALNPNSPELAALREARP
jgi:O-Antigen ligase